MPGRRGGRGQGRVRVGISGWRYPSWRGHFYPGDLPHAQELAYAGATFSTLELNSTFYSLARPSAYQRWRDAVPPACLLAVKAGRFITHMRRLRDVRVPLANFLASGLLALDDRLGPVLWQLPEALPFDAATLDTFLRLLPHDTSSARQLAASATSLAPDRTWLERRPVRPVRHALEVRHPSYRHPDFRALVQEHGVALVVADSPGKWPQFDDEPSVDFAYVRLHGHQRLYGGSYPDAALRTWATRALGWAADGRDVFVYFNNDADGRAPFDALRLAALVGDDVGAARPGAAAARRGDDAP